MSTLDRLRNHSRVEIVDDERGMGNGVIVTLKRGWTFDALCDNRVAGGETLSEAARLPAQAVPFDGPYEGEAGQNANAATSSSS